MRAGPAEDVAVADDLASLKAAISRHNSQLSQTRGGPMAPTADLDEFIEEYHGSIEEVIRGNPEPQKKFWSRADDATLANPLGPPGRGWQEISQRLDHACSLLRDGEAYSVDRV
ncbi:MAG: hypothetical protein M3M99_04105, partial [Actinomycetota bacterium]|nr:hypothetical protein [Actinomycetota bacterium]